MRRAARLLFAGVGRTAFGVLLTLSSPARATYSLISADSESGELGGFAISCIGADLSLSEVIQLSEHHIVAAQGYYFEAGRDELVSQLQSGAAPPDAITAALAPHIDPPSTSSGPSYRQYAALTLDGVNAQHSGADLSPFAGHISGRVGTLTYLLQGNLLTDSSVLMLLEKGFTQSGADIAERSISALETLAHSGGGDVRCAPHSGDAGYFVWHGQHPLPISVEIVEANVEMSTVLAHRIREEVEAAQENSLPNDDASKLSESDSTPDNDAGCSHAHTRGSPWLSSLLSLLAIFGLCARRRATKSDS